MANGLILDVQKKNSSKALSFEVHGEEFVALPERALFWPAHETLVVADLHWGKAESFQLAGIPVPQKIFEEDLERLSQIIDFWRPHELLILGDLIHQSHALTPELSDHIGEWRSRHSKTEMSLILGNHDRGIKAYLETWGVVPIQGSLYQAPFVFSHYPKSESKNFVWAGHVHPYFRYQSRIDRWRRPCFFVGEHFGILPAFSSFTGGAQVRKKDSKDRILLIAESQVYEL